jgi:hypothetical protein
MCGRDTTRAEPQLQAGRRSRDWGERGAGRFLVWIGSLRVCAIRAAASCGVQRLVSMENSGGGIGSASKQPEERSSSKSACEVSF